MTLLLLLVLTQQRIIHIFTALTNSKHFILWCSERYGIYTVGVCVCVCTVQKTYDHLTLRPL